MIKSAVLFFFFISALIMPAYLYCEDVPAQARLMQASGTVSEVDPVGSVIVLNAMTGGGAFEAVRFAVSESTKMTQGTEDIFIDDIDIGDSVVIEYYINSSGDYVAVRVTDDNIANNQM
ncbi:MAG: hypothetical protein WCY12_04245 [Candidatus Omnitrophota bacterium]